MSWAFAPARTYHGRVATMEQLTWVCGSFEARVLAARLYDEGIDAHNKFITYWLFPQCRYTVGLTRSTSRVKVSVGSNPWASVPRTPGS